MMNSAFPIFNPNVKYKTAFQRAGFETKENFVSETSNDGFPMSVKPPGPNLYQLRDESMPNSPNSTFMNDDSNNSIQLINKSLQKKQKMMLRKQKQLQEQDLKSKKKSKEKSSSKKKTNAIAKGSGDLNSTVVSGDNKQNVSSKSGNKPLGFLFNKKQHPNVNESATTLTKNNESAANLTNNNKPPANLTNNNKPPANLTNNNKPPATLTKNNENPAVLIKNNKSPMNSSALASNSIPQRDISHVSNLELQEGDITGLSNANLDFQTQKMPAFEIHPEDEETENEDIQSVKRTTENEHTDSFAQPMNTIQNLEDLRFEQESFYSDIHSQDPRNVVAESNDKLQFVFNQNLSDADELKPITFSNEKHIAPETMISAEDDVIASPFDEQHDTADLHNGNTFTADLHNGNTFTADLHNGNTFTADLHNGNTYTNDLHNGNTYTNDLHNENTFAAEASPNNYNQEERSFGLATDHVENEQIDGIKTTFDGTRENNWEGRSGTLTSDGAAKDGYPADTIYAAPSEAVNETEELNYQRNVSSSGETSFSAHTAEEPSENGESSVAYDASVQDASWSTGVSENAVDKTALLNSDADYKTDLLSNDADYKTDLLNSDADQELALLKQPFEEKHIPPGHLSALSAASNSNEPPVIEPSLKSTEETSPISLKNDTLSALEAEETMKNSLSAVSLDETRNTSEPAEDLEHHSFETLEKLESETPASVQESKHEIPDTFHVSSDICRECHNEILPDEKKIYDKNNELSGKWHKSCFVCTSCTTRFSKTTPCYIHNDYPYCESHFFEVTGLLCFSCKEKILDDFCLDVPGLGKAHIGCFKCNGCGSEIDDEYFSNDTINLCTSCVQKKGSGKMEKRRTVLWDAN